jgi:hypothetical protein
MISEKSKTVSKGDLVKGHFGPIEIVGRSTGVCVDDSVLIDTESGERYWVCDYNLIEVKK